MTPDSDSQSHRAAEQSQVQLTHDQAKDLARTFLKQGRLSAAQELIQQLRQKLPMDAEVILLAASCEFQRGHPSVARSLVRKASHVSPDLDKVKEALAELDTLDRDLAGNRYLNEYLVQSNRHMDYPRNIQLETVGRCNAKCDFCPHGELDRKFESMSDSLFEKIVNEASVIPATSPLNFFMNVVNEPFMDKNIFSKMRLLNERIPHATIGIYTNMSVMPALFFEKLSEIKQITFWNVSFQAANKAEYERSMGIDFERSVANIKRFLDRNRKEQLVKGPILISRTGTGGQDDTRFIEECKSLFAEYDCDEEIVPFYKNRADWLGQVKVDGQSEVPVLLPCNQWLNISIFCNGVVPHCCMDAQGRFPFGDVNKQSILEIYNSPHFRNLRENVVSRDVIYPCNTCALL